jgi:acyltransferase
MSARIGSIDTARFLAIVLVFYGHLVEQVMYLDNAAAAIQYKWVYSFHMPLFYVLSGIVHNEQHRTRRWGSVLGRMLRGRLVPYAVFALLPAGLALAGVPGWFPTVDLSGADGYLTGLISTLRGLPAFNIPLWFLASLVVLELLHRLIGGLWRRNGALVAGIIGFYALGYAFNRHVDVLAADLIVWMAHVVPLGYAFYLTGILIRRSGLLERSYSTRTIVLSALVCLVAVTLTFDLNQGPFRLLDVVVMMFGTVGHPLLFPFTALAGSALIILLARLLPAWPGLEYLGAITLVIYCLHGLFYHFVNPPLAAWMQAALPVDNGWPLGLSSAVAVALSVAVASAGALAIQRFVPAIGGGRRRQAP